MNRRPVIVYLLWVLAFAAFAFATTVFLAPDLTFDALASVPALFAKTAATMAAGTAFYFGGLSRHGVLAAVSTLYRVRDRAYRQDLLATGAT